jgi:hypothetical protein
MLEEMRRQHPQAAAAAAAPIRGASARGASSTDTDTEQEVLRMIDRVDEVSWVKDMKAKRARDPEEFKRLMNLVCQDAQDEASDEDSS